MSSSPFLEPLTQSLDAEDFVSFVSRKGIASRTYQALKSSPVAYPSKKERLEKLKLRYLAISIRNSYYQEELKKVLTAFREKDTPVIPLKGITLSQRLYGDITSRDESVDLDLLVKEEDKEIARTILEQLGYTFYAPLKRRNWHYQCLFTKPRQKAVELHWDITLMLRSKERIAGLWQGTELIEWQGVKYYDFRPEELLLFLCSHLVNSDSFRTLRPLYDIRRLLEKYSQEINWRQLAEKARKWKLSGSLYAGLKLQRDFFGSQFLKEIEPGLKLSLPKKLFIRLFADKKVVLKGGLHREILDIFLGFLSFNLIEAVALKDYLSLLKWTFFPPKESMRQKSYILRIFKVIVKVAQAAFRLKK